MVNFKIPEWVNLHRFAYNPKQFEITPRLQAIKEGLNKFRNERPVVSVVIPAFNEENGLLHTLSSLAAMSPKFPTELIVVNNNSTDNTQAMLNTLGVKTILEVRQGISYARETGLLNAKGKYILSADADAIYPPDWIDTMVSHLLNNETACVYGGYSFLDTVDVSRPKLALYELITRYFFRMRTKKKPYLNVMGFNSGYRQADVLKAGGFKHHRKIWEDGRIAMVLGDLGKINFAAENSATVWTTPRRILMDGGFTKGIIRRIKKEIRNVGEFIF